MYGNISRHCLMDVCVDTNSELISPGGLLRIDCLTTSVMGTPTCWNLLDFSSRNHSPVTTFSSLWQQVTHRQHCISHNNRSDKHSLIGSPIKEPMNCNFPYCVDTFPIEISWCRTWIKRQKMHFMVSFIFSVCMDILCDSRRLCTHSAFAVAAWRSSSAEVADAPMTVGTHITPLQDETQRTQTYGTLTLISWTAPPGSPQFQKFIFQLPVEAQLASLLGSN